MTRLHITLRQVLKLWKDMPATAEEAAHYERAIERAANELDARGDAKAVNFAEQAEPAAATTEATR